MKIGMVNVELAKDFRQFKLEQPHRDLMQSASEFTSKDAGWNMDEKGAQNSNNSK